MKISVVGGIPCVDTTALALAPPFLPATAIPDAGILFDTKVASTRQKLSSGAVAFSKSDLFRTRGAAFVMVRDFSTAALFAAGAIGLLGRVLRQFIRTSGRTRTCGFHS